MMMQYQSDQDEDQEDQIVEDEEEDITLDTGDDEDEDEGEEEDENVGDDDEDSEDMEQQQQPYDHLVDATDEDEELTRIKVECSAMVSLLKNLGRQEHDLTVQLEVLAREALNCGYAPGAIEPPMPKRRRTTLTKKKQDSQSATDAVK